MYTDAEGYNYMVTEYMSRGNLRDFLDANEKKLAELELLMMYKLLWKVLNHLDAEIPLLEWSLWVLKDLYIEVNWT